MSRNLKAILSPSAFLDSSCYSEPESADFSSTYYSLCPFGFESEDYVNISHFKHSSLSLSSTMSHSQSIASPLAPLTNTMDLLNAGVASPNNHRSALKPPMPALPRPLNISAYTQPIYYGPYIDSVLTPSTKNLARSSLTTMAEDETLAIIRKKSGPRFTEIINHELRYQVADAPETWIRDVVFNLDGHFIDSITFRDTFRHSTAWNTSSESFRLTLPPFTESAVLSWLNDIADMLGTIFGGKVRGSSEAKIERKRLWSDRTANCPPTGGTQSRKPDLSLFDRELCNSFDGTEDTPGWEVIQAFAEVTQSRRLPSMIQNIVEKAYLIFETQPFRRYVIVPVFFGGPKSPRWALVLVDRSGVIVSKALTLNGSGGITLAQVIYCLSLASPHYIGIDESMTVDRFTGVVTHITVSGETPTSGTDTEVTCTFKVVRLLHATPQVSGRATRVWLVSQIDKYFVLKDSWPLQSKPFSEIRHLLTINQTIQNDPQKYIALKHIYPVLVVGQELGDSTDSRRQEITTKPPARVHRRIVTEPIGDPLTSFRSKFELCSILCDVVTYLQYTAEDCRVCHGDISLKNIVINRIWSDNDSNNLDVQNDNHSSSRATPPVPIEAHGLVIDNDNSFSLDEADEYGYQINSGTIPFMALESLKESGVASQFKHLPKHDLESLFYVILTLCTYVDEPGCLRSPIPESMQVSIVLNEWWSISDLHTLARQKGAQLDSFDEYILQRLPPYWTDFHPFLKKLHAILWPENSSVLKQPNNAIHSEFLKVFLEAQAMYRDNEEEVYAYAPIIERPVSAQKRKEIGEATSEDTKRRKKHAPKSQSPTVSRTRLHQAPRSRSSQSPNVRRSSLRLAASANTSTVAEK